MNLDIAAFDADVRCAAGQQDFFLRRNLDGASGGGDTHAFFRGQFNAVVLCLYLNFALCCKQLGACRLGEQADALRDTHQ